MTFTTQCKQLMINAVFLGLAMLVGVSSGRAETPSWPLPTLPKLPSQFTPPSTPIALSRLSIDPTKITISGISSGAFMSVQFHLAHSKIIRGVGSVAGGIYWCAEGDSIRAQTVCMAEPDTVDVARSVERAKTEAGKGELDPLEYLAQSHVYLFQGEKDTRLRPESVAKLSEFYRQFVPGNQITVDLAPDVAHGFPTPAYGADCAKGGAPFLLKCGIDTAENILSHLYPGLGPAGLEKPANLFYFEQKEFGLVAEGLHRYGAIYIPDSCKPGSPVKCGLHLALHGCKQNPDYIEDKFEQYAGYNRWAEANNIVIVYPKAAMLARNPYGCWDWFGYSGPDYASKKGTQIKALRGMIEKLSGI